MGKRITSGIIASVILIGILVSPPVLLSFVVLAVSIAALREFYRAMGKLDARPDLAVGIIAATWIVGNALQTGIDIKPKLEGSVPFGSHFLDTVFGGRATYLVFFLLMIYLFLRLIFQFGSFRSKDAAYTVFGIAYIPMLLTFALRIRLMPEGHWMLWIVAVGSVMTDVFAYFVGVTFGRHKMLPVVSPKKSWEGAIGGVIGCSVSMMVLSLLTPFLFGAHTSLGHFAILGLICGVITQIGDWTASAFKRESGIKDYGNLLPGHGGMMDRLDSFLVAAPAVFLYISLFMRP